MDYTILSVSGKPGLYKLVSRAKMNLIVESLDEPIVVCLYLLQTALRVCQTLRCIQIQMMCH